MQLAMSAVQQSSLRQPALKTAHSQRPAAQCVAGLALWEYVAGLAGLLLLLPLGLRWSTTLKEERLTIARLACTVQRFAPCVLPAFCG